jgi:Ca2+-binding RTX toxin-like protein
MRRVVLALAAMALALLLASGVAMAVNKVGTDGPDTLRGTNASDNLVGKGGKDVLYGLGGSDNLVGGHGNDSVQGDRGSDNLVGNSGNDLVVGWAGSDNVMGAGGIDLLVDGPFHGPFDETSEDTLSGADGNDVIFSNSEPAFKDMVTCGSGFDRVHADRKDVVARDCERVAVGPAAVEELHEELADSGFFENFFGGLPPDPGV